jgi:hypothetical protein
MPHNAPNLGSLSVAHVHCMNDDHVSDDYSICGLSPSEAGRLMEALKDAGIVFHADFVQPPSDVYAEGDSYPTRIIITVPANSEDALRKIEAGLFDDRHQEVG